MRTYTIPVIYNCVGFITITAENQDEAVALAQRRSEDGSIIFYDIEQSDSSTEVLTDEIEELTEL